MNASIQVAQCRTTWMLSVWGAPDRTRTCTSEIPDPKSGASTNSATSACAIGCRSCAMGKALVPIASAKLGFYFELSKYSRAFSM